MTRRERHHSPFATLPGPEGEAAPAHAYNTCTNARLFGYCIDNTTTPGCKHGVLDSAAAFLIGAGDDHYFAWGMGPRDR